MYKLLGNKRFRTFRILWMLEELAVDFDFILSSPHSSEVLKYNVSGKIPVLIVEGQAINESVAILTYLADKHNRFTQLPGTVERAYQDSLTQTIMDEFDSVLWTSAKNLFFFPESRRTAGIKENLKWEFEKNQSSFVKRMGESAFLAGNIFSIADILFTNCFDWAEDAKFEVNEPKIINYLLKIHQRNAYKSAKNIS